MLELILIGVAGLLSERRCRSSAFHLDGGQLRDAAGTRIAACQSTYYWQMDGEYFINVEVQGRMRLTLVRGDQPHLLGEFDGASIAGGYLRADGTAILAWWDDKTQCWMRPGDDTPWQSVAMLANGTSPTESEPE